jgi:hypothetical protein
MSRRRRAVHEISVRVQATGLGYYSYTAGPWHVVALNSEARVGAASPQMQWLRADLTAHRTRCTAAFWHKPLRRDRTAPTRTCGRGPHAL